MADLGAISLWIALALSIYSAIGSVVGKILKAPGVLQSAHRAAYLVVLALLVATLSLVASFISQDFQQYFNSFVDFQIASYHQCQGPGISPFFAAAHRRIQNMCSFAS